MKRIDDKNRRRAKRRFSIRKKIFGTAECPRMTVFRSAKHLYIQVIDDESGKTLAAANTMQSDYKGIKSTVEGATKLGEAFGKILKEKKIKAVVFDRNGYRYHGVVKALADGTRKSGIKF